MTTHSPIDPVQPQAITATEGGRWGWAAYLGASWTWCIGMFLPVLLVRDYGPWAWVIFAVPNAVGAAAMGWVMRSQAMSHDYTIRHASACRLFSFVTIAFQLFFTIWWLPRLMGPIGYIGPLLLVQAAFTPFTKSRWLRIGGAMAIVVSLAMVVGLKLENGLHYPSNHQSFAWGDAVGLSLVCLAGFVTCPYLDLTFHRGRMSTNHPKFAFGVGFCGLFFSMIVLTFFYATDFARLLSGINDLTLLSRAGQIYLAVHLLAQMSYTVNLHAVELHQQSHARDDAGVMRAGLSLWLAIGLAAGLFGTFAQQHDWSYGGRSLGEACYRVFMSFYGLLFPAYVLLAIRKPRVSVIGWLAISAAAVPFYWLAFLEAKMAWASVGVAVIVLGAIVVRRLTPPAPAERFE